MADTSFMEKLVALCRRRGFIFQSSEIYGGIGGFWDYGPLGVELKRNIKDAWWHDHVTNPPLGPDGDEIQMVGLDCSIIMNPKVWEASGHATGFADPMQTCRHCKKLFRADQVKPQLQDAEWYKELCGLWAPGDHAPINALRRWAEKRGPRMAPGLALVRDTDAVLQAIGQVRVDSGGRDPQAERFFSHYIFGADGEHFASDACPNCGGDLTEPRMFNLMFKTYMGPVEDAANIVYLRPETAQGIYVNFHNIREASRQKLPFGIAQIGKAFRNEITPGNFIFRMREFEQMEMQYFVKPGSDEQWFEFWKEERLKWYERLGIRKENLEFHQHSEKELAHYAKAAFDIQYKFPFGWQEIEGIHNRTDFDLGRHQEYSKKNLQYFDQEANERYIPYVIETSTGVDRLMLTTLADAYDEDQAAGETRVVLRFDPRIAPMKAAIFPLVKKDGMPEIAHNIVNGLRKQFRVFYDEAGAVGRRYRRQDEIGTPYCFTVDSQTLQDGSVTVRNRDSMAQERISQDKIMDYLVERVV